MKFSQWYSSTYQRWPYHLAFTTCFIKGMISDSMTQKVEYRSKCGSIGNVKFDLKRNMRFAFFAGSYTGCFQHWLYNIFYARLFPGRAITTAIRKTIVDNAIHMPLVCLPTYYSMKALFLGQNPLIGLKQYWTQKWVILKPSWMVWGPMIFIITYAVPPEFRVFAIAVTGILWLSFVSFMSPMKDGDLSHDHFQQLESSGKDNDNILVSNSQMHADSQPIQQLDTH